MKTIVRRVLIGGIVLFVLAYVAVIAYMAINEAEQVYAGASIDDRQYWLPATDAGFPWDTFRGLAPDGVGVTLLESRLHDDPMAPWAVFFHGNGVVLGGSNCVQRYELLRAAGFNVLAVEFRGYGVSRGFGPPSESGLYADALGGLTYLTDSLGVDPSQIVAYGWSFGAGIATYLAEEKHIGGLVTEGAFTSLPDHAAEILPWLPVRLIMRNRFDNLERAENLSLPWLLFHGRTDSIAPFSHAETLEAASTGARLTPLNAGHFDGVLANRDVALAALRLFAAEIQSHRE